MSGSGSAVFGIFEDETSARKALEEVGGLGSVFIAHSLKKEAEMEITDVKSTRSARRK